MPSVPERKTSLCSNMERSISEDLVKRGFCCLCAAKLNQVLMGISLVHMPCGPPAVSLPITLPRAGSPGLWTRWSFPPTPCCQQWRKCARRELRAKESPQDVRPTGGCAEGGQEIGQQCWPARHCRAWSGQCLPGGVETVRWLPGQGQSCELTEDPHAQHMHC